MIGSQIHVRHAVVVDVANRYAAAIVVVAIFEDVEIRFVDQSVFKIQMGICCGHESKQTVDLNNGRLFRAGKEQQEGTCE